MNKDQYAQVEAAQRRKRWLMAQGHDVQTVKAILADEGYAAACIKEATE